MEAGVPVSGRYRNEQLYQRGEVYLDVQFRFLCGKFNLNPELTVEQNYSIIDIQVKKGATDKEVSVIH